MALPKDISLYTAEQIFAEADLDNGSDCAAVVEQLEALACTNYETMMLRNVLVKILHTSFKVTRPAKPVEIVERKAR